MAPKVHCNGQKGFCPWKGLEHALDYICNSPIFVVAGISEWKHDGWSHSYSAGNCHHRIRGRFIQGRKILERIGSFPEKVRYLERNWSAGPKKILPGLTIPSSRKGPVMNLCTNKFTERITAHGKVTIKYFKNKGEHYEKVLAVCVWQRSFP
jgi:hypothetical protein